MSIEFGQYKEYLNSQYNNNNIQKDTNLDENMIDSKYENQVMNTLFPYPEDKEVLNNIYNQIGMSDIDIKSFDIVSECMKLISYMKEPEIGTYEYEMYQRQMELILFWDKYEREEFETNSRRSN